MIAALRDAFAHDGFADLTAAIPGDWRTRVNAEVTAALDAHGVRRDVTVASTGESPRRYRIAGRDALTRTCPETTAYYRSPFLLSLVAGVAGEAIAPVPYVPEELIATRLERAGDTHGWHWDDYAFALVWVLRAPPASDGAALEFIANEPWCKAAPRVDAIVAARKPARVHVAAGTVYLLRTDTTLHRVTPLLHDVQRDALCLSYAATRDLQRNVTHETLDTILAASSAHV